MLISSPVQQKDGHFQRDAILHNYVFMYHNCVCHYLRLMPQISKLKQATLHQLPVIRQNSWRQALKSGPVFILRNICFQLCGEKHWSAWSRTLCYRCCSSIAHCAPRPEQSAELPAQILPTPAGNSCCPTSSHLHGRGRKNPQRWTKSG